MSGLASGFTKALFVDGCALVKISFKSSKAVQKVKHDAFKMSSVFSLFLVKSNYLSNEIGQQSKLTVVMVRPFNVKLL